MAAEAHAAAAAEGLTLLRAENSTGFKGVWNLGGRSKPFQAMLHRGGRKEFLGHFATALKAGPTNGRFTAKPGPAPMTAAEAHAAAASDGLTLVRSATATTGFKGVSQQINGSKPFKARLMVAGSFNQLGYFATAEEAALAVAK